MGEGALYDHLGGGFHRYARGRAWPIPHFEKMLCDNDALAEVLVVYQACDDTRCLSPVSRHLRLEK